MTDFIENDTCRIMVGCPRCCGLWCVVCCVVWCVVWCVGVLFLFSLNSLLSLSGSLSFFLSLFLSSLFSCLFFLFLFSLPFSPTNTVKHWSTNVTSNFEAFTCDLEHGRCTALASQFTASLPPPFTSPSNAQKKVGNFLLQEHFRRGNYFALQFYINSEKSTRGEITDITVLY